MSVTIPFELLLDYSEQERHKWRDWIAADEKRLDLTVQAGARFATVAALLDHIFLAERRNLARLEGGTPPDATGIPPGDWTRLFEYADLVHADLRRYASDATDTVCDEKLPFVAPGFTLTLSRRLLLTHILLHEVRHLAQLALAARNAGIEPPGNHDVLFFAEA
jgi:uncharacterized damage-inducible protein DinB